MKNKIQNFIKSLHDDQSITNLQLEHFKKIQYNHTGTENCLDPYPYIIILYDYLIDKS